MPTNTSTQQFIKIDNIRNDVVILKNGQMRAILQVSSINLALKSQNEQEAIVASYQNFLNSLDFPIQILINSRFTNLDEYLKNLEKMVDKQPTDLMQIQTQEYINFILEFTQESHIISTDFFVIIPFDLLEMDVRQGGAQERFKSLFGKQSKIDSSDSKKFALYKKQLLQRVNFVASGLSRMGISAELLNTKQLISLFWSAYNPSDLRRKKLTQSLFN